MGATLAQRIECSATYLQSILRLHCPFDTGNLAFNGISIVQVTGFHYQIIIGSEIADYAIWTDVPWIAENHGGHNNPNQGWVENAVAAATPMIRQIMGGELSMEQLTEAVGEIDREFREKVDYTKIDYDTGFGEYDENYVNPT